VVHPDTDPAFIAPQVIHAVRNRLAVFGIANDDVMYPHMVWLTLAPPDPATILEIAHQLLLLRIHGNGWVSAPLRARNDVSDIPKLRIPTGMLTAFPRLDVALEGVAQLVQQFGDDGMADRVAQGLERGRQCPGTFAGPSQRRSPDRRAPSARPSHRDHAAASHRARWPVSDRRPAGGCALAAGPSPPRVRAGHAGSSPAQCRSLVRRRQCRRAPVPALRSRPTADANSVSTDASGACFARSVANRTPHGTRRQVARTTELISYFLTHSNVKLATRARSPLTSRRRHA
jgi:hypothetical protein